MKQISDVLVIGSGIIGAATAYALTRQGMRRVSLIEKGPLVSGMTRRNAGLVHPFHAHPLTITLAEASYPFYQQWAFHLGNSKTGFVETGAAVVAENENEADQLRGEFFMLAQQSSDISQIEGNSLASLFPGVAPNFRGALFTPRAGYADAVQTTQAMVNKAKENGLQVHTGTQVKQIIAERGQIRGVVTTTGTFETPAVIVAAGGWAERLLAPLGVSLRLQFRRGVVMFYEQPAELPQGHPMLLDPSGNFFLRPHPYRMSAAGSVFPDSHPNGIDSLDDYIAPSETLRVVRFAADCIPAFAHAQSKRAHSVLYDSPWDGLPVLGRVQNAEGLFVAAGFGTSAFAVAPAVGQTLAQIVIDGSATIDVSTFSPSRASLRH